MPRLGKHAARIVALIAAVACTSAAPAFDPKQWLDDLAQARHALTTKYANLEWAVFVREADLPGLFAETEHRIKIASSAADARAAFDRLARRLSDGHVQFHWKLDGNGSNPGELATATCKALGYDSEKSRPGLAAKVAGYHALESSRGKEFPTGLIEAGPHKMAVLRIGMFAPQGSPELCEAALDALSIARDAPCDDACSDRVSAWAHNRMTFDLAAQLGVLKAAGADILLIDITDNGGGSEWAEAAARMLTAIRLKSERMAFVRGEHWARRFSDDEEKLRRAARTATGADKQLLLSLAREVEAKRRIALTQCDGEAILRGIVPPCRWLSEGFYASGLLASADPTVLRGKAFAEFVFTPMQFPFEEGVWKGPLIVLVNSDTYSAAEEFAAVLQDNHAAVIMGEPTGGAGCGHTNGGTPEELRNSGAILEIPDCVRLRADGSNEIMGVEPDVLVGFTPRDGERLRVRRFLEKLGQAIALVTTG